MNDNNDIIRMLRDREEEFHLPLRKDGWQKLEAGLASSAIEEQLLSSKTVSRNLSSRWWIAAAVLLCLLISVPLLREKQQAGPTPEKPFVATSADNSLRDSSFEQDSARKKTKGKKVTILPSVSFLYVECLPELPLADISVQLPEPLEVESHKFKEADPMIGPRQDKKVATRSPYMPYSIERRQQSRWSVGVQAGCNQISNGNGGLSYFDMGVSDPGLPPPDPDDPDKPAEPDYNFLGKPGTRASIGGSGTGDTRIYYSYNHHLPITVGFSIRRHLFSRLSVETGLTYTYLYSDISGEAKSEIGNQKLHYIGIPLKAGWTLYDRKSISLYASAGAMLEYCISATNTFQDLRINRWQPSLNAAVGAQVNIIKPWSIFLEPGISYYYNMNRANWNGFYRFETIRMVHPLTFNLQVGIRFSY